MFQHVKEILPSDHHFLTLLLAWQVVLQSLNSLNLQYTSQKQLRWLLVPLAVGRIAQTSASWYRNSYRTETVLGTTFSTFVQLSVATSLAEFKNDITVCLKLSGRSLLFIATLPKHGKLSIEGCTCSNRHFCCWSFCCWPNGSVP